MPSPFKEVFCERHRARLDVPVLMGVGGSFDVLAGYVRRAPPLLRQAGLEWSWRLLMEPRKMWKRYLTTNTEFIWVASSEILGRRRGECPPREHPEEGGGLHGHAAGGHQARPGGGGAAGLGRLPLHVVATGQHKEMFWQVTETFGFQVDTDLDVMRPNQTLAGLTSG
jgi:hypothetical protein